MTDSFDVRFQVDYDPYPRYVRHIILRVFVRLSVDLLFDPYGGLGTPLGRKEIDAGVLEQICDV